MLTITYEFLPLDLLPNTLNQWIIYLLLLNTLTMCNLQVLMKINFIFPTWMTLLMHFSLIFLNSEGWYLTLFISLPSTCWIQFASLSKFDTQTGKRRKEGKMSLCHSVLCWFRQPRWWTTLDISGDWLPALDSSYWLFRDWQSTLSI